jgi:hypothetical protein
MLFMKKTRTLQTVSNRCGQFRMAVACALLCCLGGLDELHAQIIPAERLAPWNPGVTVGVLGGIPANRTVFTNMAGLNAAGQVDISTALQNALNTCPPNQVVVLPAGTFLLANIIYLSPNITLRGAGMDRTVLKCVNTGSMRMDADNTFWSLYQGQVVTSGLTRGSTNIVVPSTTDFEVGKPCLIGQFSSINQYDPILVVGVGGTNAQNGYIYRVIARVTGKTATSISIWPPIYGDMSARHARIKHAIWRKSGLGIEGMTLNMTDSIAQSGIILTGVQDSWVKDVRIRWAKNRSIAMLECLGLEIRDSYFDDLNHGGSNGAGVLMDTVCASLIENNIVMNSFPGIEVNAGSCGNVIGYNFLLNTNGLVEIDSNHGPHNAFNLYEGNITGRFLSDSYFGSESDGTVFRNWLHGQIPGQTSIGWTFALKRFNRNYSLVGNVLGSPTPFTMVFDGTSFGQPNMGNGSSSGFAPPWADWLKAGAPSSYQELDTNVVRSLVRKGNYNFFNRAIPAGEALAPGELPNSLYRSSKPAWFGSMPWPPIDPSNPSSLSFTNIPAGLRYVTGATPVAGAVPLAPTGLAIIPQP